jgi:hypothetical protein
MPRQAAAARAFSANGSTRDAIRPPDDLAASEKAEFIALVLGAPPSHFCPSDVPLLAAYAKAIVGEKIAARELASAYVIDDKPSPWLPIWQAKVRALTTLSRMLCLNPGGRIPSRAPESAEPAHVNHYARIALEQQGGRDEAN